MTRTSTRHYSSALRAEQAAETRRRVLQAAGELFAENGYAATSLIQIARRAGVSVDTVQATGPKRDLLLQSFEVALIGVETTDPLTEAPPEIAALFEVQDLSAFLAEAVRLSAAVNGRTASFWQAFRAAAAGDPAVAEHFGPMVARRRRDHRRLIDLLVARGADIPAGRREELADELVLFMGQDTHWHLVHESGWTQDRYLAWTLERVEEAVRR